MGFPKFLNLQLFPSCFQVVGSLHPRDPRPLPDLPSAIESTIKLVTLDGQVKTYHHTVPVSKLMAEFPKHLICRSDTFYIGRKIPALSEHDLLEPGHNYFLLPNHFFQSVLTFVTVASFVASRSASAAHVSPGKKAAVCKPFDILRTPSGSLRIHVSDEFISQLVEEGKTKEDEEEERGQRMRLCSTPQLKKDYIRLVEVSRSGRWKPKLETITESRREIGKRRRKAHRNFRCTNPPSSVAAPKVIKMRSMK
ncbi:hypothetical protein MLD38_040331 [Melastoma candidum]|uniref:Uncharacterized protein n=1 Tax=Melastoma candidum TaxID=119954 RepID=A0ACB9L4X3_9MYRT|nr:hypothetical protein MLD38_040331 [Melastoma candidum]